MPIRAPHTDGSIRGLAATPAILMPAPDGLLLAARALQAVCLRLSLGPGPSSAQAATLSEVAQSMARLTAARPELNHPEVQDALDASQLLSEPGFKSQSSVRAEGALWDELAPASTLLSTGLFTT